MSFLIISEKKKTLYISIYIINDEYCQEKDSMGAWWHEHIHDDFLNDLDNYQAYDVFNNLFGHFDHVIRHLYAEKDNIIGKLKNHPSNKTILIQKKLECEKALHWLITAQKNHIDPSAINLIHIPDTKHIYSEYRLMEDFETENRNLWKETIINSSFLI